MTEREIILGFLDPAAAGTGGDELLNGTLSPTWTVNSFKLLSAYPNPFQHSTQISFQLQQPSHVLLEVYTMLGERVAVIMDGSYEAGQYSLDWNPRHLSSGAYFLQLKAGKLVDTGRLMLIR